MLSPRRHASASFVQRAAAVLFLGLLRTAGQPLPALGAAAAAPDPQPHRVQVDPFRKEPYLIYPGDPGRMQVLWQLVATDTCTIQWGVDSTCASGSVQTTEYGADHQHTSTIAGLTPGQNCFYRVTVRGASHGGSFHAAPAPSAPRVEFLVYGDTRSHPATHEQLAAAMIALWNADPGYQSFALLTGDLVGSGTHEADWSDQLFDPSHRHIRSFMAQVPFQSCIGNHEEDGVLFVKYFPYPFAAAHYGSFDYGPAHFVIVDQYTSYGPGSEELQWIAADLAGSTKPWKFICLHEPGWSAGGNHPNNTRVQNDLQPLCVQYGVSIVFGGHNHYYARAVVDGVHHVTAGGGGAPLYPPEPTYPNVVASARRYHFCTVQIDSSALTFRALEPNGTLLDTFSIRKAAALALCDIVAEPGRGYVDLEWSAFLDRPAKLQVLRSTEPGGGYRPVSDEMDGGQGAGHGAYRDRFVDPATEYYYKIGWRETGAWNWSDVTRVRTPGGFFGFRTLTPNPSGTSPSCLQFELARSGRARVDIYDSAGKRVRTVADGKFRAGVSSVFWDGREQNGDDLPPGVYRVQLAADGRVSTRKLVKTR